MPDSPSGTRSPWGRLPSAVLCAIRLGGGLRPTLRLIWQVARREGWRGIAWRFQVARQLTQADPDVVRHMDYTDWLAQHDSLDAQKLGALRRELRQWAHQPRISILMPVYDPPCDWLEQAIQSVREQLYPHWELCIADDASTNPAVPALLARLAADEPRIKWVRRSSNGHICAASNSALELVTGEFVALLDHDDRLPVHALLCVAQAIAQHPDVALIYSDEDKIDARGRRSDPYFKPAFNYDLFLSQNMVSHLGVYRSHLVRQLGGFRAGFEGSQDYDLALRCIEHLQAHQIVHIPQVLYHWRSHADSTAADMDAKPYAALAAQAALNEHLGRVGESGHIRYVGHGYRHTPARPQTACRVSVIVFIRHGGKTPDELMQALHQATSEPVLEFLFVACPSLPPAVERRRAREAAAGGLAWFGAGGGATGPARVNQAAQAARGEVLALLSEDIAPRHADWLGELLAHACRPGVALAGPRLWCPDGPLAHAGLILGAPGGFGSAHWGMPPSQHGYFGRAGLTQNFSAVSSACWVIRKTVYQSVAGLDTRWQTLRHATVDLCLRLQRTGLRCLLSAEANLNLGDAQAWEGWPATGNEPGEAADAVLWAESWRLELPEDPHYSPNLGLTHSHFALAWPPRSLGGKHSARDGSAAPMGRTGSGGLGPWSTASHDSAGVDRDACAVRPTRAAPARPA